MSDVQFQDNHDRQRRPHASEQKGKFTKFLNKQGLSDEQARKVLYGIAIGAFVLSLFFWF